MEVKHTSTVIYTVLPDNSKAFIRYKVENNIMKLLETYTPPQHRGKGIAGMLMDYAIEMARKNGYLVEPICSYSIYYFIKHKELRDILAEPYRSMSDEELKKLFEKRLEEEKSKEGE
ncbi:GNAT family N-acetyltransferase [Thermogladius sp. 4427co]|uniref:GNAT family N-acetyltransferase n=1 Tax=Thermogladius sp. 4427co TaxID=3450718 RepID=UPI003F7B08DB